MEEITVKIVNGMIFMKKKPINQKKLIKSLHLNVTLVCLPSVTKPRHGHVCGHFSFTIATRPSLVGRVGCFRICSGWNVRQHRSDDIFEVSWSTLMTAQYRASP